MDTRNWEYKGLQLSNRDKLYNFQIQRVDNTVNYNSSIYENNINNGAYSTNTTVGVRVIRFFGTFYGTLEEKREAYTKLKEIIKTEDFPSIINRGFYTLKWTDKRGQDVQAQAKVYKPLETEEEGSLLNFSFTLLCDDPFYYWQVEKSATGGLGVLGGNTLTHVLPNNLMQGVGAIEVNNEGDRKAGIFVRVLGDLTNPRITNITTGETMKIEKQTTKLEVDNRERPFTVFDDGANAKSFKLGQFVYLAPGINNIVVSSENYTDHSQAEVTIYYRNTYE